MPSFKDQVEKLIAHADIRVDGARPWDANVHDPRFYSRLLREGSIGLGESYMDGWWDAESLDDFFVHVLRGNLPDIIKGDFALLSLGLLSRIFNFQSKSRAFEVGQRHYDIGNDLFRAMLDKRLTYTCAYWKDAKTLDEAQEAKLELVCRKLGIKEGDRILDIGCGWGSFAKYAAQTRGAVVTGVTVSQEQIALGKELCAGLPVTFKLQDYRDIEGSFDHVVSLGMFEHVGYKNHLTFMRTVNRCLKEDGLFLLHVIGSNISVHATDPWIDRYIFPNGCLPSIQQIGGAIEHLFVMEDWHNFGADYDKTLMAWWHNVSSRWDALDSRYDERFRRMWKYYLLSCAADFRIRDIQLWQAVLSKHGVPGGYRSVR